MAWLLLNFSYLLNKRALGIYNSQLPKNIIAQMQEREYEIFHESTFMRRGNELPSKTYCISFCNEDDNRRE
jgi:hypothetical protein